MELEHWRIENVQSRQAFVMREGTMRKVKVNLVELADAFDNGFDEITYYLDTETGETVLVTSDDNQHLEAIYEAMDGGTNEPRLSFEEALQQRNIPGWQQEMVRTAVKVEEGFGTRFFRVPRSESHDGYRDMEDFIDGLPNARVQERLSDAIRGRGPFRRFKDVLLDHPSERERWFAFQQARVRERAIAWLADEDIEPITDEAER
jgi:hypothetical protein